MARRCREPAKTKQSLKSFLKGITVVCGLPVCEAAVVSMKKLSLRVVIGFLLFFAGVAALLSMTYGGDLLRDVSLRGQALEMHPTARVVSAKCTRYYFTVSACNTEYENLAPGQPSVTNFQPKHELRFLVFGSVAGERVMMMRPRPSRTSESGAHALAGSSSPVAGRVTYARTRCCRRSP